jgi:hypothetical protein
VDSISFVTTRSPTPAPPHLAARVPASVPVAGGRGLGNAAAARTAPSLSPLGAQADAGQATPPPLSLPHAPTAPPTPVNVAAGQDLCHEPLEWISRGPISSLGKSHLLFLSF